MTNIIVIDNDLLSNGSNMAFYLRTQVVRDTAFVDLAGAVSLPEARKIASEKGFNLQGWVNTKDGIMMRF